MPQIMLEAYQPANLFVGFCIPTSRTETDSSVCLIGTCPRPAPRMNLWVDGLLLYLPNIWPGTQAAAASRGEIKGQLQASRLTRTDGSGIFKK